MVCPYFHLEKLAVITHTLSPNKMEAKEYTEPGSQVSSAQHTRPGLQRTLLDTSLDFS